jgi:hypothetical protein
MARNETADGESVEDASRWPQWDSNPYACLTTIRSMM